MSSAATPDALVLPVLPNNEIPDIPANIASSINAPSLWSASNTKSSKALETRVFHQERNSGPTLSLVALGKDATSANAKREAARKAVATGVKAARDAGARSIGVVSDKISDHDSGEPVCLCQYSPDLLTYNLLAVAATLSLFDFTLQTKEKDPVPSLVSLSSKKDDELDWNTGLLYAEGQNLAREVRLRSMNITRTNKFNSLWRYVHLA